MDLMIPESKINPVDSLPSYDSLKDEKAELLEKCVVLKLNGGLGTGVRSRQAATSGSLPPRRP